MASSSNALTLGATGATFSFPRTKQGLFSRTQPRRSIARPSRLQIAASLPQNTTALKEPSLDNSSPPLGTPALDSAEEPSVSSLGGGVEDEGEEKEQLLAFRAAANALRPAPEAGSFWGGAEGISDRDAAGTQIAGIPMFEWLKLSKPSRYLGNEFGAIHKSWDSAKVRFCLTYPEIYEVGASNLGHILLYTVLNRQEGLLCDRAYFVDNDMAACMQKYGVTLFGVESRKAVTQFDTLGFSLAYELGATNILEMLNKAGIPLTWAERHAWEQQRQGKTPEASGTNGSEGQPEQGAEMGDVGPLGLPAALVRELGGFGAKAWQVEGGDSLPLIFAGGPTATSNPEPFADFFDFFAIGDGEECLVEIGQCLDLCKEQGLSRLETLVTLARTVPGVYVPQLYEVVPGWGATALPRLEGLPATILRRVAMPDPLDQIGLVPFTATVHDRLTVEIRRGCTRGCRFCQPGMLTRPARDVDPDRVVEAVEVGMRKTGYTEFSLLSLSCSDYLALPSVGIQIKNRLKDEPIALSLPSQRVDRFNDDIANIVGGTRKGSLTFAPEAGTQRMRDIINKGLTDEELLRGIKAAWDRGWRQVKLYFMIGLPGETDEDVLGIARTVRWLQAECRRGRKNFLAVKLTVSNFTPKPHTPFQWHSVSTEELKRKQRLLKSALARLPGVKYYVGDVRLSAMEDFIGRGDRSISAVIRRAWELGATNDAWWNNVDECYKCWNRAIDEQGCGWKYRKVLDGEWDVMEHLGDSRFRGQGGKGRVDIGEMADPRLDAPLPWDIINTGIEKWWLKADLQRALEAKTIPDCSHSGECSKCGVCSDDFGDNVVAPVPEIPPFDGDFQPDRTRGQRIRVRYAKYGSMMLIGHLDLIRLFDRALRRAALPICYDNGFHSLPRLSTAVPLPLGHSSSSELIDIELTRKVPLREFRTRLQEQLPGEVALLEAWEEPVFRMDGKNEDTLTRLVFAVEYILAVSIAPTAASSEADRPPPAPVGAEAVKEWVRSVLDLSEFKVGTTSKRTKKDRVVDYRSLLRQLQVLPADTPLPAALEKSCPEVLSSVRRTGPSSNGGTAVLLRYECSHTGEGGSLRPEGVLAMLQEASEEGGNKCQFQLLHAHRSSIMLKEASKPKIDRALLKSIANDEAFRALYRRYDGSSGLLGDQPKDFKEAAEKARMAAVERELVAAS